LLLLLCGCGTRTSGGGPVDQTRSKLQAISGAYLAATMKTKTAPKKVEDLLPFLGDSSAADDVKRAMIRSDNDGEEFVIVLGVDLRKLGTNGLSRDVILAYEKRGTKGQRYVLKPPVDVFVIPDDLFQKSKFANDHRPEK
jgi:hypothetical protein